MGNTSLHSRLAQALAKAGSYKPEESSPFGAKPVKPIRHPAAVPNVPRISNVADLIAEDYIVPTVQGSKAVGGFVREHPAETVAGIAAGLTLPVSVPGVLGAGALGIAGRAIDKTHPLTDERSDYDKQSSKDIAKDLLISGGVNALAHGIFGPLPEGINPSTLKEGVLRRGPLQEFAIPENPRYIPTEEIGGVPGYKVLNYDYIPGATKIEAEMANKGIPRFVPASSVDTKGAEFFGDKMVGNPAYMSHPSTPEGKILSERIANRDPEISKLKTNMFSGVDANEPFDPEMVVGPATKDASAKFGTYTIDGFDYNPKWGFIGKQEVKGTNKIPLNREPYNNALTYAYPIKDDMKLRQIVMDRINKGLINETNLPKGFSSVDDLINRTLNTNGIAGGRDIELTRFVNGLPENSPIVQELIPLQPSVHPVEKSGKGWATNELGEPFDNFSDAWKMQRDQLAGANSRDQAGVLYKDVFDVGGAMRAGRNQSIGNVLAVTDPRTLKYPFNYGLYDLGDLRPLASIPLAAGLGAGVVANQRQE